ncbi:MAG TPA: hypothetical protein VKV15_08495 [Bryobacteraceae bacterium]|nr:hypothetical protein [Bryobacteraceae bacterium]
MSGSFWLRFWFVLLASSCAAADFSWQQDLPEHHGMSREALDAWRTRLAALQTKALLVVRDDKIVYEWYASGENAHRKQGTASLAKAIVGGTSLMLALEDGRIKIDDRAAKNTFPLGAAIHRKPKLRSGNLLLTPLALRMQSRMGSTT